jgi:hypothetical protein
MVDENKLDGEVKQCRPEPRELQSRCLINGILDRFVSSDINRLDDRDPTPRMPFYL